MNSVKVSFKAVESRETLFALSAIHRDFALQLNVFVAESAFLFTTVLVKVGGGGGGWWCFETFQCRQNRFLVESRLHFSFLFLS
jgi:hypothetical protein